jgi:chromosome segregation ATPase
MDPKLERLFGRKNINYTLENLWELKGRIFTGEEVSDILYRVLDKYEKEINEITLENERLTKGSEEYLKTEEELKEFGKRHDRLRRCVYKLAKRYDFLRTQTRKEQEKIGKIEQRIRPFEGDLITSLRRIINDSN